MPLDYIRIEIETYGAAYQEVSNGQVQRYLDPFGVVLFNEVPSGHGSWVVDANPPRQSWMV